MKPKKTFLYQKLYDDVRHKIASGTYPVGQLLPSERELGETFQVDRTTVRRALQMLCDEGFISKLPGKGAVVMPQDATAPSGAAAAAHGNTEGTTRRTIGFFLPKSKSVSDKITFPTYTSLLYYVEHECSNRNIQLVYTALDDEKPLDEYLLPMEFDGILFLSEVASPHITRAVELGIPSVLINNHDERMMSVAPDNYEGGRKVARHFLNQGYRRFVALAGNTSSINCRERIEGFRSVLLDSSISCEDIAFIGGDSWSFDSGYEETRTYLKTLECRGDNQRLALFACGDRLALGAMRALNEAGIKVPEKAGVIGYDNSEQAVYSVPRLTSVDTNLGLMASTAVRILLEEIINREFMTHPLKTLVPNVLVERDTTGARNN